MQNENENPTTIVSSAQEKLGSARAIIKIINWTFQKVYITEKWIVIIYLFHITPYNTFAI